MELSELIKSVDIVEYISQFADVEEKGGEYWCLSPLKEENTPSFSMRREEGVFYDFSSGVGGNVLTFICEYFKCNVPEGIRILKAYSGLTDTIKPLAKMTATLDCRKFKSKQHSKKSTKNKVLAIDCMKKYEKRPDKLSIWEREGISNSSLDRFQVYYDAFSDRLVYPITDLDGSIVNIGGRTLDPGWKEKGLRKYTYFYNWGQLNLIYGLYENLEYIKNENEIIIFEGCKSVLLADTWGIKNCGALLTSHLNPQQVIVLAKLGARVVFALDKDIRIRDDKNIKKLKQFVNVEYIYDVMDYLDEKDSPVDKGQAIFKKLYDSRMRYR